MMHQKEQFNNNINIIDSSKFIVVNIFPIIYSTSNKTKQPYQYEHNNIYDLWVQLHLSMLNSKYKVPIISSKKIEEYDNISFLFITCTTIIDSNKYDDVINSDYFVYENLSLQCNDKNKLSLMIDTYKLPNGTQVKRNVKNNRYYDSYRSFTSITNNASKELHVIYDYSSVLLSYDKFSHISGNYVDYCKHYVNVHDLLLKYWIVKVNKVEL